MIVKKTSRAGGSLWRIPAACALLLLTTACSQMPAADIAAPEPAYFVDPALQTKAIKEASAKRANGQRVWCVPFARTLSGIDLRGNAGTWWKGAEGNYARGAEPQPGSVMAFRSTKKMPMGHVAVVSEVVSSREILIDHANWSRNKVTLKMPVVDVSEKNDWSKVRVESAPGTLGGIYPINGFIYPDKQG